MVAVYAREAVGHAWLVDPIARRLEVLHPASGSWTTAVVHRGDEAVRAAPFAAVELPAKALWAED